MYRLELKSVSRGKGASVVAKSAYIARIKLVDERQGIVHDYSARRSDLVQAGMILPDGAPNWMLSANLVWNRIDAVEKRKDAETAKSLLLTLPRGATVRDLKDLVRDYVRENISSRGLIAQVAIHSEEASDGKRNWHAHIMFSERPVDPASETGFAAKKDLSRRGPEFVYQLREAWEAKYNSFLENKGLDEAPVTARAEWKQVRDLVRAADDAPLPQKLVAIAKIKEFQSRPSKAEISSGEYQAAGRRPESGYQRRRRDAERRRRLIKSRRAQIDSFAAGVRRAFPDGRRRIHHLAAAALNYFERLLRLQSGDPLPPVPFDRLGAFRFNRPGSPVSSAVPAFIVARRNAERLQEQDHEMVQVVARPTALEARRSLRGRDSDSASVQRI
jgi:hypothetical protein